MFKFWQKSNKTTRLYVFMFLFNMLGGAIRKWVITGAVAGNIIFAVQMVSFYFFIFTDKYASRKVFKNRLVVVYFAYLFCSAFNPLNATIFHGIFGIVLHFGFWFAGFYYLANRDKFEFEPIVNMVVFFCLAELILSVVQYGLPSDSLLNRYSDETYTDIAKVGDSVRVSGSFSYIAGYTSFLLFLGYFCWVLFKKEHNFRISIGLMLFGVMGASMSGSRGGLYIYFLIIGFVLFFVAKKKNLVSLIPFGIATAIFLFSYSFLSGKTAIQDTVFKAINNFEDRRTNLNESGEEKTRVADMLGNLADFKGEHPIFGIGLGATYQGAVALFGSSPELIKYGYIESENEKIVLEGGVLLLFLKVSMIIYFSSKLYVSILGKIFIGMLLYLSPPAYNVTNALFTFLGIVMVDHYYYKEYLMHYNFSILSSPYLKQKAAVS